MDTRRVKARRRLTTALNEVSEDLVKEANVAKQAVKTVEGVIMLLGTVLVIVVTVIVYQTTLRTL